jgi:HEAT repeat protein
MGSGDEHWRRVERLETLRDAGELQAVLEEDEKECWHTKTAAIRSLVAMGQGGASILKTLARDKDPDVRQAAIEALGELRFPQAARVLRRIADDQADPMREKALRALEKISGG